MELAAFAEELAEVAAKEILPFWRQPLEVQSKIDDDRPVAESPVTIADRNAERAMRDLIEARYPHHGIVGEELGEVRADAEFCWVLDPIDGTKSFITGKPLFGTLIGLCRHGRPVIGVIDQCVLKERWVGVGGQSTKLNGKVVSTRGVGHISEATVLATTPHMFSPGFEAERFDKVRRTTKRTLYGSDCYAYGLVASGFGADLVIEADLKVYDYAALVPVLRGAGGVMTDWQGCDLTLRGEVTSGGRVVASANASLHEAALCLLRDDGKGLVLKSHLVDLPPYKPPLDGRNAENQLLLDFNERTTPPPKHVTEAVTAHLESRGGLIVYPSYGDLQNKIAEYATVKTEQCMFTNGSDQGIDLVIRCCCPAGTEAVIPGPSFAMYQQAALTEGLDIKSPSFTRERGFPFEEVLAAVTPRTSVVVISNPNNPTGTAVPREQILEVARRAPHCAILVDECYFELMPEGSSVKDVVEEFRNIFITRTFSKTWGLASLRLGYLLSAEANIRSLSSVRGPYDVNKLAVVAVNAALADSQYVAEYVAELNGRSKPRLERFLQSKGIIFWPSHANYLFCYFQEPKALEAALRARNIMVRPKSDADGVLGLRVSIGTLEDTETLIAALTELLS